MSIKRNTLYNLFNALFPIGVTLLALPQFLSAIGGAIYINAFAGASVSWVPNWYL